MADERLKRSPLKRIYFDTNALFRWPNAANNLMSPMRIANWLNTELCLPKPVEDELEGQFVCSVTRLCGNIGANVKELKKVCRHIAEVPFDPPDPGEEDLREAFRKRSTGLKDHYKIATIPNTKKPAEFFLEMAVNRIAPFEEYLVRKDRSAVAGFQDAFILYSIIEDGKTLPSGGRCAFVTNDTIFQSPTVSAILKENGLDLEIFRPGDPIFSELWNYVWDNVREAWDREDKEVEQSLNRGKELLTQQILSLLPISEVGRSLWKVAREIKGLRIRTFSSVRTELPESEYRPPSAEYRRPENSEVRLSAEVAVEIDATVENFGSSFVALFSSQATRTIEPEAPPKLENATLSERFNVSLTATVRNGVVADFRVVDVQRDK